MPDIYICAGCGLSFPYGDHDAAEAEAARNGFDPAECLTVCDGCFQRLQQHQGEAGRMVRHGIIVGPTIN